MAEKLKMRTENIADKNFEALSKLFPNAVTEAIDENGEVVRAIDADVLRQEISCKVVEGREERYQFNWPDKKKSIQMVNSVSDKTLRPVLDNSKLFDSTGNLYIEGDNFEVLKVLQETYLGKIRMIYIDPPYNTGRDAFVYNDSFSVSNSEFADMDGQYDSEGNMLFSLRTNTEAEGKFHTNWLNMMYMRLKLAKNLLADDGVIFISIDDNEVDNLKKLCTEIFGESNFIGCAGRITKKSNNKGDFWAPNFDYIITFVKNRELAIPFLGEANTEAYNLVDNEGPRSGEKYQLVRLYMSSLQNRNPEQRFWIDCPDGSKIIPPGSTFPPERPVLGDGIWRWSRSTFEANLDKIVIKRVNSSNLIDENGNPAKWNVFTKTYLNDVLDKASAKPNSFIENHINQNASHELNALDIPFDYSKPTSLIKYLMEVARVGSGDIVMDFFSGSATTADAVMQFNAESENTVKFMMIQIPEKIEEKNAAYKAGYRTVCDIGKERIRRAGKKIINETHKVLDVGFRVLKLATSNMKDVYYRPADTEQKLIDVSVDNIKPDRTSEDLLFQVMLDLGVLLSSKIEEKYIAGKKVFNVADGFLVACFDKDVTDETIREVAKMKPYYAVFRDSSMASDSVATNFDQIFASISPDTIRKVL